MESVEEVWAEILGHPDYAVSNYGRVWNVRTDKMLRLRPNSYGYLRVALMKDGVPWEKLVHQLVAEAFITGYYPSVRIRHHDGDNSNNQVYNLRFRGGARHGVLRREVPPPRFPYVVVVDTGQIYINAAECARAFDCDVSSIYRVLRGERTRFRGFTIQYYAGEVA